MPGDTGRNRRQIDADEVAHALRSMLEEDQRVRDELVARGVLFDTYHARMERVHLQNAERLDEIFRACGWPDEHRFGEEGEEAAWILLMHSISRPDVLRRGRRLLEVAVERGTSDPGRLARVEDRIRTLEGRPQLYGSILDWDENGDLSPLELESPADVDRRRSAAGLPPLAQYVESVRRDAAARGDRPPSDPDRKQRAYEEWLYERGWR